MTSSTHCEALMYQRPRGQRVGELVRCGDMNAVRCCMSGLMLSTVVVLCGKHRGVFKRQGYEVKEIRNECKTPYGK